eukprot:6103232-Pyramimonas_sp.AAC.1
MTKLPLRAPRSVKCESRVVAVIEVTQHGHKVRHRIISSKTQRTTNLLTDALYIALGSSRDCAH